eukprot:TRINITY_DN47749_c0_g1_i1.p1 TRINITY_DN47749_c0_g1~~TRINITY_DN47749_c0_g1_i1.p1  ORF type:complete len:129 (-),score=10.48 TRINITY_DN47749_c0_g1_i1:91-477(-)
MDHVLQTSSENMICNSLVRASPRALHGKGESGWAEGLELCLGQMEGAHVDVVQLDTLLARLPARVTVPILKIDAHGGDWDVVLSVGSEIHKVHRLILEVRQAQPDQCFHHNCAATSLKSAGTLAEISA